MEHTIKTQTDDLLCWYSDGLIEAHGEARRGFGTRRLRGSLARSSDIPPAGVLDQIVADFDRFQAGRQLDDDVTCVVGRITS